MKEKKWWESSTIWINLSALALVGLDYVIKLDLIKDVDLIAIVVALINILRRFQAPVKVQPIEKAIV